MTDQPVACTATLGHVPSVSRHRMRDAIAEALYPISAYQLADFCDDLDMPPAGPDDHPMSSKRAYVRVRLKTLDTDALLAMAHKVHDETHEPPPVLSLRCRSPYTTTAPNPVRDVTGVLFRQFPTDSQATARPSPATAILIRRVGPGSSEELVFGPPEGVPYLFPGPREGLQASKPTYEVELEFTDAAGLRWRRRGTAPPTRVIGDTEPPGSTQ